MKLKKNLKRIFSTLLALFVLLIGVFALPDVSFATSGSYEYNDFRLFGTNGTQYAAGAFRSNQLNNGSPMSSFGLCINVYNNTWYITGGSATAIPFPTGTTIDYTDRTTFLQTAYYTVNGTRYNFTILSNDDTSGNFYSSSIPAAPYYPVVYVYLPVTGSNTSNPGTPTLSVNQDSTLDQTFLTWTPNASTNSQAYARVSYKVNSTDTPTYLSESANSPFRIYDEGYYNVCLAYYVDGQLRYTDWSNTVHVTSILTPEEEEVEHDLWWLLQQIDAAVTSIRRFLGNLKGFYDELFDWLPAEVMAVFWAVLVVSLVIRIFIK